MQNLLNNKKNFLICQLLHCILLININYKMPLHTKTLTLESPELNYSFKGDSTTCSWILCSDFFCGNKYVGYVVVLNDWTSFKSFNSNGSDYFSFFICTIFFTHVSKFVVYMYVLLSTYYHKLPQTFSLTNF